MNEDLIKKVASELSSRLLSGQRIATPASYPLVIFCDDCSVELRQATKSVLPYAEHISSNNLAQRTELAQLFPAFILVAPSLDLAAKITNLQTDCPSANFVIKALFNNKRVLVIAEGMLAPHDQSNLRLGLKSAIHDLRAKLTDMGVEFVSVAEVAQTLKSVVAPEPSIKPLEKVEKAFNPVTILPVLTIAPTTQHPTQQRFNAPEMISEIVDFIQTKPCSMEKGKPCDQCDICNSLGF